MRTFLAILILTLTNSLHAISLVSDDTVKIQKKLTKIYRLDNHIPVIYRQIPNSDILELRVDFKTGSKDFKPDSRKAIDLLFATLPLAAVGYAKEKVYELTEKYALSLNCSSGVDVSSCRLGTVNDFWDKGLPLLSAVINRPALNKKDIALKKQQLIASTKSAIEDPSTYVNDVVNRVFYPKDHPYYEQLDESLEQISKVTQKQIKTLHHKILSASNLSITVVGSIDDKKLIKSLNDLFGNVKKKKFEHATVNPPKFSQDKAFAIHSRDVPTAYIRIKFNSPGATDKDAVASKLLMRVLNEELWNEIRTKRSLSYAVYSYTIPFNIGIGVIGASTSKPKETIEAINKVIQKLKDKSYTKKELEEFKTIYATKYFLTQEEHSDLASALSSSYFYHKKTDKLYDMPKELGGVSPRDIKRLANQILVNPRIGIIYDQKKFKDKWAKTFIKEHVQRPENLKKS